MLQALRSKDIEEPQNHNIAALNIEASGLDVPSCYLNRDAESLRVEVQMYIENTLIPFQKHQLGAFK